MAELMPLKYGNFFRRCHAGRSRDVSRSLIPGFSLENRLFDYLARHSVVRNHARTENGLLQLEPFNLITPFNHGLAVFRADGFVENVRHFVIV